MERLASLSVDLDSTPHYCRIHGLRERILDERSRALVASTAIPRLLELFADVPVTLFVIGDDLADERCSKALAAAAAARDEDVELASHSASHDYALSRWTEQAIEADLRRAHDAIAALGRAPVGFRAPGYTLSPALLSAVANLGYAYDSSALPSAPYYLAKAAVMGALAAVGRPSRSILGSAGVLVAPSAPYRPSLAAPYRRGEACFVELPVSVTPVAGLPFIGTFLAAAPWALVRAARASLARAPLVNLEFHAIDFVDASDGLPRPLVDAQPDLRVPLREKLRRFREVLASLRAERELVTLAGAAARFG